ncbi:MAG: hypothetical protein WC325_10725 [Candidatus Bathyarchaeia archaeon]
MTKGIIVKRTATINVDGGGFSVPEATLPLPDDVQNGAYLPDPIDDVAKSLVTAYGKKVTITVTETFEVTAESLKL